jgi:hypothetical protein
VGQLKSEPDKKKQRQQSGEAAYPDCLFGAMVVRSGHHEFDFIY